MKQHVFVHLFCLHGHTFQLNLQQSALFLKTKELKYLCCCIFVECIFVERQQNGKK